MKKNKQKMTLSKLTAQLSAEDQLDIDASVISGRFVYEIDQLRQKQGLNKKEFAEKLGVTASYLTQVFRGDKQINTKLLAKVERALDVRVEAHIISANVDSRMSLVSNMYEIESTKETPFTQSFSSEIYDEQWVLGQTQTG